MSHTLYLWVRFDDTETGQKGTERMVPMDTSDREEAVKKALEWMFHHVSFNRDLVMTQACIYSFSENILHLHQDGLEKKLAAVDEGNKANRIRSLEQQLKILKEGK